MQATNFGHPDPQGIEGKYIERYGNGWDDIPTAWRAKMADQGNPSMMMSPGAISQTQTPRPIYETANYSQAPSSTARGNPWEAMLNLRRHQQFLDSEAKKKELEALKYIAQLKSYGTVPEIRYGGKLITGPLAEFHPTGSRGGL